MEHFAYLISDCARLLRRGFDENVRHLGVTGQQARLLFLVERSEGENQSSYASLLEVEPITLCRMVDRMEDAGLISRKPDPEDRRARRLFLTPHAREMIRDLRERVLAMTDEVSAAMTPEQFSGLQSALETIRAHLTERREQTAAING